MIYYILITYSSGAFNTQIDYILARNKDMKLGKDVKAMHSKEVVSQHYIVVSDVKINPCKVEKQLFILKRWVLEIEWTWC